MSTPTNDPMPTAQRVLMWVCGCLAHTALLAVLWLPGHRLSFLGTAVLLMFTAALLGGRHQMRQDDRR